MRLITPIAPITRGIVAPFLLGKIRSPARCGLATVPSIPTWKKQRRPGYGTPPAMCSMLAQGQEENGLINYPSFSSAQRAALSKAHGPRTERREPCRNHRGFPQDNHRALN